MHSSLSPPGRQPNLPTTRPWASPLNVAQQRRVLEATLALLAQDAPVEAVRLALLAQDAPVEAVRLDECIV